MQYILHPPRRILCRTAFQRLGKTTSRSSGDAVEEAGGRQLAAIAPPPASLFPPLPLLLTSADNSSFC